MWLFAIAREWYLVLGVSALIVLCTRARVAADVVLAISMIVFFMLGWPR